MNAGHGGEILHLTLAQLGCCHMCWCAGFCIWFTQINWLWQSIATGQAISKGSKALGIGQVIGLCHFQLVKGLGNQVGPGTHQQGVGIFDVGAEFCHR